MRDAAPASDLVRWGYKTIAAEPGPFDTPDGAIDQAVQREQTSGWEVVAVTRDGGASVATIRFRRLRAGRPRLPLPGTAWRKAMLGSHGETRRSSSQASGREHATPTAAPEVAGASVRPIRGAVAPVARTPEPPTLVPAPRTARVVKAAPTSAAMVTAVPARLNVSQFIAQERNDCETCNRPETHRKPGAYITA